VAKFIAKFDFQPLQISLSDRPLSAVIDPATGDLSINQGEGSDRVNGTVLAAKSRPMLVVRRLPEGCGIEAMCGGRVWTLGETADFNTAQMWVTKANQFIATKSPAPTPDAPRESAPPAARPQPSSQPQRGEHRPFRKGAPQEPQGDAPFASAPAIEKPTREKPIEPPQPKFEYGRSKPSKRELDAQIEADLAASLAGLDVGTDLASTKENSPPQSPHAPGQKKKGRVVKIHGDDVFIELPGGRSQGLLSLDQFEGKTPALGEEVEVEVERYDGANGLLILTRSGAAQKVADWSGVQPGMVVEVRVTGANKGGLAIELGGIRGFLPFSQIDIVRVEQPELLVNSRVKCMIMEANPHERNLVVSRRMLIEKEREANAAEFWSKLEEGQTRTGTITSIKPFGAFVDLGGADGLIPMGELSWSRVADASEVVKVGQSVEVRVIRIDRDARKIGLSLKALNQNPWDDFATRCRPGTKLTGKVTRIAEFGAFVEVEPGIEGLLHVSELSTQRVRRVRDAVSEGQMVEVQVTQIDPQNRRLGLSLRALSAAAEDAMRAEEAAALTAKVQEEREDRKVAEERMATRKPGQNLRGGIGSGGALFTLPGG
jgi:small subunit ribosomal protein S1